MRLRLHPSLRVIEVRSARLPDGGIVTTYTDVTQSVAAEEELAAANERLERRVQERTAELERLNHELARAKTAAEDANLSKTRFLAAAGHDILQPLNAARLYASSLTESAAEAGRGGAHRAGAQRRRLARSGGGNIRRAARYFAARRGRDAAGDLRFSDRRKSSASSKSNSRRWRGRRVWSCSFVADLARRALGSPPDAPAVAEPRLQRRQIYAPRPGAGGLPAPRGRRADRGVGHRDRHSAGQAAASYSRSSSASTRAPGRRAASASGCRSSSGWGACSAIRSRLRSPAGRRLGVRGRGAARRARAGAAAEPSGGEPISPATNRSRA